MRCATLFLHPKRSTFRSHTVQLCKVSLAFSTCLVVRRCEVISAVAFRCVLSLSDTPSSKVSETLIGSCFVGTRRRNFQPSTPTLSATMHSVTDGWTDIMVPINWSHCVTVRSAKMLLFYVAWQQLCELLCSVATVYHHQATHQKLSVAYVHSAGNQWHNAWQIPNTTQSHSSFPPQNTFSLCFPSPPLRLLILKSLGRCKTGFATLELQKCNSWNRGFSKTTMKCENILFTH